MTRMFNDPKKFAEDAIAGLAAAYPDRLQQVHGGVVRSSQSPAGEVAVVIGGGSGHFPAFAGWVGPGLAHGAACGNVFASPSASQVSSVIRASDNGGGVLLTFGNYSGDVLHFGQAAEELRAEAVDVRVLTVTDDIASAPPDRASERRGVAGDLVVFKVAAAAAEAGYDLDAVEAVARRANARTRSLGVAFGGCTLPGAGAPLFSVPDGVMSVGLGVHGEPGVRDVPLAGADDVADLLVDGVLAEEPERADGYAGRVTVLVNGLGTIKHEELLVVYRRVAERLRASGHTIVLPEVGELMSSLDMAGLSLTVTFLDPELEQLWGAPVDTAGFRRGAVTERPARSTPTATRGAVEEASGPPATAESQQLAGVLVAALEVVRDTVVTHEGMLGDMDAVAGDGDHGQGMTYGATGAAAVAHEALAQGAGARTVLARAGAAWAESAGGTSGALWGAALAAIGRQLSDTEGAAAQAIVDAVVGGVEEIVRIGGAKPGDKTMVDAALPFSEALATGFADRGDLQGAWASAAGRATSAAAATADVVARQGRSRVLGDKSLGTPDPGATSFALIVEAIAAGGVLGKCRSN